jgi:hypothetical protein
MGQKNKAIGQPLGRVINRVFPAKLRGMVISLILKDFIFCG